MPLNRLPAIGRIVRSTGYALLLGAAWLPALVHPATNVARGGIGGLDNGTLAGGDGTGSATFTIERAALRLMKQARDANGAVLAPGAEVLPGQEIYFLLYVENPTDYPAADIRISDFLNTSEFAFVPGSLEMATRPAGSDDAALWAGAWQPVTDAAGSPPDDEGAAGPDDGGIRHLSFGAVPSQANRALVLAPHTLRAVRFRVRVR